MEEAAAGLFLQYKRKPVITWVKCVTRFDLTVRVPCDALAPAYLLTRIRFCLSVQPVFSADTPCAENAKINVKVIGASQEMCSYLPLLQKLPAALVIRKVKVTKHSSRVSLREIFTWKGLKRLTEPLRNISGWVFSFKGLLLLRTTLCAFSSFGKGKITAHNVGTKIGLIGHIYLAFSAGVGFWSQDICWIWICTDIWLL